VKAWRERAELCITDFSFQRRDFRLQEKHRVDCNCMSHPLLVCSASPAFSASEEYGNPLLGAIIQVQVLAGQIPRVNTAAPKRHRHHRHHAAAHRHHERHHRRCSSSHRYHQKATAHMHCTPSLATATTTTTPK
jgi:hypothetical protein